MASKRPGTWSDDERAQVGREYRGPRNGAPEELADDTASGAIEDPDVRRALRAKRSTKARLERLEDKHDELGKVVADTRVDVAEIKGDVKTQSVSLAGMERSLERIAKREDREQDDALDARKQRRTLAMKAAAWVFTGGVLGKLLHMAGLL